MNSFRVHGTGPSCPLCTSGTGPHRSRFQVRPREPLHRARPAGRYPQRGHGASRTRSHQPAAAHRPSLRAASPYYCRCFRSFVFKCRATGCAGIGMNTTPACNGADFPDVSLPTVQTGVRGRSGQEPARALPVGEASRRRGGQVRAREDGTTERAIILRPDGEERQYWAWLVRLMACVVGCPYCGAVPCAPCRTLTGRIPGRVSEPHRDRLDVAASRARGETQQPQPLPPAAQPPEGDPLPHVGWVPYDDEREWGAWLHVWVANLVECPSCGADAGQPCRTHTGRIPGRITTHHQPRMTALRRVPGPGTFRLDDARELLEADLARANERLPATAREQRPILS